MNNINRLSIVVLAAAIAVVVLSVCLSGTSTAAADISTGTAHTVIQEHPVPTLHYKSRVGLMPFAYGLSPGTTSRLAGQSAGQISFLSPYITTAVGSWSQVLALSDLTGDGRADAAVATGNNFDPPNDEILHLFAAQAGDLVSRTQRLPAGANPESIVAADLNGDGQNDVALALAGDDVLALYTQPLSNPITLTLPGAPNALAAGDFTGDLRPDLAAIAPLSATIHLWESSAGGLVPLPFDLPYPTSGYDALDVGDMDNDGDDDIVALRGAGYLTESVVVYLQDSGSFPVSYTLTPETGGYLPHSLAAGDVNGDGRDDLLVTAGGNAPAAYLNVFLQDGGGLAAVPITRTAHHLPSAVAVGDMNHDGREDIAVLHDAWQTLSVYTQTVSGTLSAYETAAVPYSDRYRPDSLALADLDGNGGLDVALVDRDHGLIILTNTITAPVAAIGQPSEASILLPGPLAISGTASVNAITVEVRLRGFTDWTTVTLVGGAWEISVTLPSEERAWWIEARAIDAQGHVQAPPARHRIGVEDGPPQGQIIINDGAYATNQPTVTLTLPAYDVGGVTAMRFSTNTVSFTNWLSYTFTHTWTFAIGDGPKTLYVQFRDVNTNVSSLVSDTIVLDTLLPTSVVAALPSVACQGLITLTWSGEDTGSGIAVYDVEIRQDAESWGHLLQQTTLSQTVVSLQAGHIYCIRSRATDRAGNTEAWPPSDGDTCTYVGSCEVEIAPPTASGEGAAGDVIRYTLVVTNAGSITNAITLNPSGNNWGTDISPTSVSLSSMDQTTVVVSVTIPTTATVGISDTVNIQATATGASDSSELTTTMSSNCIYLPLVMRNH
ncbi:MAG: hypothetical protein GY832_45355 [Chloroflexi bacterium]|nr:hypothetical protein [Chloroflexota bacterium]